MRAKMIEELKIETRNVSNLIPYAANSRTHSDAQVAQIAASVTEFGWTNPILIDELNNVIAGHGRILAAKKLGFEEVPCIVLDNLTSDQKKALVIADNKITDNAGWDTKTLIAELESLADFDFTNFGFSTDELDALLNEIYTPEYTPTFTNSGVTENQLSRAADSMASQIDGLQSDKANRATEVMCPYCAETFQYSGG
jgi:hypothetical protein